MFGSNNKKLSDDDSSKSSDNYERDYSEKLGREITKSSFNEGNLLHQSTKTRKYLQLDSPTKHKEITIHQGLNKQDESSNNNSRNSNATIVRRFDDSLNIPRRSGEGKVPLSDRWRENPAEEKRDAERNKECSSSADRHEREARKLNFDYHDKDRLRTPIKQHHESERNRSRRSRSADYRERVRRRSPGRSIDRLSPKPNASREHYRSRRSRTPTKRKKSKSPYFADPKREAERLRKKYERRIRSRTPDRRRRSRRSRSRSRSRSRERGSRRDRDYPVGIAPYPYPYYPPHPYPYPPPYMPPYDPMYVRPPPFFPPRPPYPPHIPPPHIQHPQAMMGPRRSGPGYRPPFRSNYR